MSKDFSFYKRCYFSGDEKRFVNLYKSECVSFMSLLNAKFKNGLFDMIFADPPYFLSNGGRTCRSGKAVSVNKGCWDESKGVLENHEFNLKWLSLCLNLLKPDGTIWVSGTHHVIHSIGYAMQLLQMKILNEITWEKPNPPPNLSCRYFTHSTETIIWAAKNRKSKHTFNYDLMKKLNDDKQMKSVWRITPPSKSEKKHGRHETQKPTQLLDLIILSSTNKGDVILDPFMGSCTTGVSAIKNDRNFVGIDEDADGMNYFELSKMRVKEQISLKMSEFA